MQVEIADLLDLLHPPVGPLDDILVGLAAQEEDELRLEDQSARLRVEDAVGEEETAGHQHVAHRAGGILVGIPQVAHDLGIGVALQLDLKLLPAARLDRVGVGQPCQNR